MHQVKLGLCSGDAAVSGTQLWHSHPSYTCISSVSLSNGVLALDADGGGQRTTLAWVATGGDVGSFCWCGGTAGGPFRGPSVAPSMDRSVDPPEGNGTDVV